MLHAKRHNPAAELPSNAVQPTVVYELYVAKTNCNPWNYELYLTGITSTCITMATQPMPLPATEEETK